MSKKDEFCRLVAVQSQRTADEYKFRLGSFEDFLNRRYSIKDLDSFFACIEEKKPDVYTALAEYNIDLKQRGYSSNSIAGRLLIARNFLEYNEVAINRTIFKIKVRPPVRRGGEIEALSKDLIRKILLSCNTDKRLQTYILFLAATGMRAGEGLSVRLRDIDWQKAKVNLRANYTKTKKPRYVYLTTELLDYMKKWRQYRERPRRVVGSNGIAKIVEPKFAPDDLFFSTGRHEISKNPYDIYHCIHEYFVDILDANGFESRTEDGKRRRYTFHSFRRFVKSTISDLGFQDYSEWFIGHSGSTYYRKTESEKLETFKKIEPYLTFLDFSELEANGADTQTQLEESKKEIEELKRQLKNKNLDMDQLKQEMREEIEEFKDNVRKSIKEQLTAIREDK